MITLGRGREMSQAEPKLRATIFPTHLLITHHWSILGSKLGHQMQHRTRRKSPTDVKLPCFPKWRGGCPVCTSYPCQRTWNIMGAPYIFATGNLRMQSLAFRRAPGALTRCHFHCNLLSSCVKMLFGSAEWPRYSHPHLPNTNSFLKYK